MKKILLIGNKAAGGNIKEILGLSNFTVLTAEDVKEGLRTARKEGPQLIICDLAPPQQNVYDAIEAFQRNAQYRHIPIIVLTDAPEKGNVRKIMTLGADDCLVKPFDGIDLLRSVEACLERHCRKTSHNAPVAESAGAARPPKDDDTTGWNPDNRDARRFVRKTILYTEGLRASHVWYIVDGKVKTYLVHADGKELITGILGAGDCVGYGAAVSGGAWTDNAQVLEDADLVVIPRAEFLRLLASNSAFSRQLIRWLAHSHNSKEQGLVNMAYNSLRKKVANGILALYDHFHNQDDGKTFIAISRDNLAAFVGSAPESLTRTLSDFRREGLVDVTGGRIYLLDETRLRKMLN